MSRILTLFAVSLTILATGFCQPATRILRHASCNTCNQDSPGTLSSPWYGEPEDDTIRDYRALGHESHRIRPDYRGPIYSDPRENYGIRRSEYKHSHTHPVTPATPFAPRSISPNFSRGPIQFPFSRNSEYHPRDFSRRIQHGSSSIGPKRERGQIGTYVSPRERFQSEGNIRNPARSEDQEQPSRENVRFGPDRNRDGPKKFRNERNEDGPRRFRDEDQDSHEDVRFGPDGNRDGPKKFRNERTQDGPRRFRDEDEDSDEDVKFGPDRNQEYDEPKKFRNERTQEDRLRFRNEREEQISNIPRGLKAQQELRDQSNQETREDTQYKQPEDSEEQNLDLENLRRYKIGTVIRPRQIEEDPTDQTRKERSREAEILRVTQITIDPEGYSDDAQPDMSVLRFTPENRNARPFGFGGWGEEEYVDIRKETPFGTSEVISMDREGFGPGGFQEERFTEEFDSFGWRRQAEDDENTPGVVIQAREIPKDDLSEPKVDDAVMKIAPRSKDVPQKESEQRTNPDFYGDIVYPLTNDSKVAETVESTTVLSKVE